MAFLCMGNFFLFLVLFVCARGDSSYWRPRVLLGNNVSLKILACFSLKALYHKVSGGHHHQKERWVTGWSNPGWKTSSLFMLRKKKPDLETCTSWIYLNQDSNCVDASCQPAGACALGTCPNLPTTAIHIPSTLPEQSVSPEPPSSVLSRLCVRQLSFLNTYLLIQLCRHTSKQRKAYK